jgi:hypothetical protein
VAQLALGLEVLQRLEGVVALDRVHAGVVELVEVDVVGAEAAQAGLEPLAHEGTVPALRALALGVLLAAGLEVVAEFGRDLDLIAVGRKHAADQLLVGAPAVSVTGVEEGDPQLQRLLDQANAGGLRHLAPPVRAERPRPEADLRGGQVGVAEAPLLHPGKSRSAEGSQIVWISAPSGPPVAV